MVELGREAHDQVCRLVGAGYNTLGIVVLVPVFTHCLGIPSFTSPNILLFLLFIVMFYKVTANTELANTEPVLLRKIQG